MRYVSSHEGRYLDGSRDVQLQDGTRGLGLKGGDTSGRTIDAWRIRQIGVLISCLLSLIAHALSLIADTLSLISYLLTEVPRLFTLVATRLANNND